MSLSAAALALVKALQVPVAILSVLTAGIWPEQADIQNNTYYDYIVVGGGSAGCVVAARLAQDKNTTVLLLEAGGNPSIAAMLPGTFVLEPKSSEDYDYYSTFNPYAASSQNNYTKLTSGKMLGGSASLNHFISTRGSLSDFDTWGSRWTYEENLPYFKKFEDLKDEEILNAYPEYHGTSGPVGFTREPSSDTTKYLEAFASINNPTVLDLNSNISVGYTQPVYIIADGIRQTPGYVYLNLVKDYPNFSVSKYTKVTKIVIEDNVAVGVEAVYDNKTYVFKANKEVILSAGVFNSPQLLMLSGIGPEEHLTSLNIPVIQNLPVGDNLKDQVAVQLVNKMETSVIPAISLPLPTELPFPVIAGAVPLNKSQSYGDYQTFNLLFPHDYPYLILTCSVVFGYRDEICDRVNKESTFRNVLYTLLTHLQPKSSGTVRLQSTDPFDAPLINMNYYNNTQDLEDMVDYILDFLQVQNTTYFSKVNSELAGLDLPECSDYATGTRDFWRCYILKNSVSPYHYTSSCPMGSVLDDELKVQGVANLRVVDASSLPTIPRGAPLLVVLMVAEKAAAMIINGTST